MGKDELKFEFMHKDIVVGRFSVRGNAKIYEIAFNDFVREHIPLGGQMNLVRFHEWWDDRAVPRTRSGAKQALKKLGYMTTGDMLIDNLSISLTDCYWLRPLGSTIQWCDVNLFENPFEDYFGEMTINEDADIKQRSKFSLATSQGEVRKKWVIREDGTRAMVKGNWGESYQQSINEAFATLIHKRQNVLPYTAYSLLPIAIKENQKGLGCISNCYTNPDTEFVSAWEIIRNKKKRGNMSYYGHFKNQCLANGIDEETYDRFMSYEILTDVLMTNTDRHMNNLGILRNPDTLEWYGFAPIYDTGNAMFFKDPDLANVHFDDIKVSSFLDHEKKLLRYVKYPHIVDLEKLPTKDEFVAYYEKDIPERHARIEEMYRLYERKIDWVHAIQKQKSA